MSIDPFSLEVVRNGLSSIAEEMSLVVMRSARSPLLREAGDLSSALADCEGYQIAQGLDIPMHMGVMSFTVREFLKLVPKEKLQPGDVWVLNLPHVGGNHLPDVKAIRPIFYAGKVRAFAISLAHWADIGGAAPGSYYAAASDAWQEGLRIPPLRVFTADGVDEEKMQMILCNVRGPGERRGDLLAQMAATLVAERRLSEMFDKWGAAYIEEVFEAVHDRSERQMRAAIANLPNGVYEGEDFMDDDGHGGDPVPVRVRIEVKDDTVLFDYSDSADAVPGPINTTRFITASSAFYVMKAVCGPDIQSSAGCYRPIEIVTRPGSIVDAGEDKPVVGGNHETCQRIADAAFKALDAIVPERLSAGGPTTSGLILIGANREDGLWTTFYEVHAGGEGARTDRDGADVTRVHMANVMNTPAEIIETEYPINVEYQRLRNGSGGAGRHQGGQGQERAYRMRVDNASLTTMFERAKIPPYGLQGGEPGQTFEVGLTTANSDNEVLLHGKANLTIGTGDLVVVRSSGGGGYGQK